MSTALKMREYGRIASVADKFSVVGDVKATTAEELIIDIRNADKKQRDEISDLIEKNSDASDWEIAEALSFGE